LVAQSPIVHVQPLFGETGLFALARPIPVVKGEIVALTVPTWLPALSVGYADSTSWRASRSVAQCQHVGVSTMQTTTGSKRAYDCLYQAALINYGVTERSP
jgi:hypothetical protein